MTFGQIIKKLRKEATMTQEKLAELLSISPQAVSRWETDAAMPDISLLPPLATLFNVTTDYLLGMDTYQMDLRKAEYDKAFKDYWLSTDKEQNYLVALRAATEYPGNMEYIEWLASAEFYVAFYRANDAEYHELLDSSAKHYNIVLENSNDKKLCDKALHGIVLSLHYRGKSTEAKEYAMRVEYEAKRNELLLYCLEGEEKQKLRQQLTERKLNDLLFELTFEQNNIETYEAVENILHILFPDGNFQNYHNTLQYNHRQKAFHLCNKKCYDEAILELQKAKHHTKEMVKYLKQANYNFTSPFFNLLKGENSDYDPNPTDLEDFFNCLNNNSCFDPIRERDEFKKLFEK